MKKSMIAFIALTLLWAVSCAPGKQNDQTATEYADRIEPVRTIKIDYQTIARAVNYTATLQAYEKNHMAPASPGRIEDIYVEIGDHVNKGDVLVQMNRTQLHQAEVQLRTLEDDFERLDTLNKVGSIPQQQYDQLKAQVEIARNNLAFLRENTRLHAPFSGVVSGKYFEPGEMFSGAPNPRIGKAAIISLIQLDKLKAIVPVSESFFPLIETGQQTVVTSDIYPGRNFHGRIFRIHPSIDPMSRTFSVEIILKNCETMLIPGMFIRVKFVLEQVQAMIVPAISVLKLQGSNERYLFIEENGNAKRVAVSIGKRYDDGVEVISDVLRRGDRIIVSGQARLTDGVAVRVINN